MKKEIEQTIKGDDNTQQNIGVQINNNYGVVTKDEIREISRQTAREICAQYATLSSQLIDSRLESFEHTLIHRLENVENSLSNFSDPGFVWLYKQAQIRAAISGEKSDYELLCELLVSRTQQKENKYRQTGIDGAIQIVDKLSDSSLAALTILCCVTKYISPISPDVNKGLERINQLYKSIICETSLPSGDEWMDQLDVLKAIRINTLPPYLKFKDIIPRLFNNYISLGVKKGTKEYDKAMEIQRNFGFGIFQINPLNPEYIKLPYAKEEVLNACKISHGDSRIQTIAPRVLDIFDLYDTNQAEQQKAIDLLCERIGSYPYISMVGSWWDGIPYICEPTSVGKAIAYANGKKCCPNFPDLN